jgi:hypothetical protein
MTAAEDKDAMSASMKYNDRRKEVVAEVLEW